MTRTALVLVSVVVAWAALASAVAAMLAAPSRWCNELGTPVAVSAAHIGLAVGVIATGVGVISVLADPMSRRRVGPVAVTVVAAVAVAALVWHHVPHSTCG